MRCLTCHYELKNLTEHRCPECGLEFDPDDPGSYESKWLRRRIRMNIWILLGFWALCMGSCVVQLVLGINPWFAALSSSALGVVCLTIWVCMSLRNS